MRIFAAAGREIGPGRPCYVIAEIGSNHDCKLAQAYRLIELAAKAGADAVKFQCLDYGQMYAHRDSATMRLFERIRLDESWYPKLKACADLHHVHFFASPCYLRAIGLLGRVRVPLYKIASPQTRWFPQLITAAARTGKPLVISTGYCSTAEIDAAVEACRRGGGRRYALLHCVSRYPTRAEDVNLAVMDTLRARYGCPVGFSDHTTGDAVAVAAVARGADIIEKHVTLDRGLPGPDHPFAMEMDEFARLVASIRAAQAAIGRPLKRLLPEEQAFSRRIVYRLVAARCLRRGEPLRGAVAYKRAPTGIPAERERTLARARLARDVEAGAPIAREDLQR